MCGSGSLFVFEPGENTMDGAAGRALVRQVTLRHAMPIKKSIERAGKPNGRACSAPEGVTADRLEERMPIAHGVRLNGKL